MLACLQVVGYATKFLNLAPDLTVLRDPVVVAGVVGFFQARGLAPMTVKLRVQHITQGSSFVSTRFCPQPRGCSVESAEVASQITTWFKKLSAKVLEEAQKQPKKLYSVELWEAWDFATRDWVAFVQEFQVSVARALCVCVPTSPQAQCPLPCRPATAPGPGSWPGGARQGC